LSISALIWRSCDFRYTYSKGTPLKSLLQSDKVLRKLIVFYLLISSLIAGILPWRLLGAGRYLVGGAYLCYNPSVFAAPHERLLP
jgi:hypothetical protein